MMGRSAMGDGRPDGALTARAAGGETAVADASRLPPGGRLVPIAGGWLVRRYVEAPLMPERLRRRYLTASVATLGAWLAIVKTIDLSVWMYFATFQLANLGAWATLAHEIRRRLRRRIRLRDLARARRSVALASLPVAGPGSLGTVVRLAGTVRSAATFLSPVTGAPAVLASGLRESKMLGNAEVLRGIDFDLVTKCGAVSVLHAQLLDDPVGSHPICRDPVLVADSGNGDDGRHGHLPGGDRRPGVSGEITGTLVHDVDPTGEGAPVRGTRLVPVLCGSAGRPLVVRSLAGEVPADSEARPQAVGILVSDMDQ